MEPINKKVRMLVEMILIRIIARRRYLVLLEEVLPIINRDAFKAYDYTEG